MKKFITDIRTLAALLMAGAAFTACSSDDNTIDEQPVNPAKQTYTLTVKASKGGDATTRALTLTGEGNKTLKAYWDGTETVTVKEGDTPLGTLTVTPDATDNTQATLSGELDAAPSGTALTLELFSDAYNSQEGTLDYIASHCDYATATTTVTYDAVNKTVTGTDADFTNQQAIIKFTLKDKANDAAISPSALTVTDGTSTVELTSIPDATYSTNGGAGVLYVAFPAAGSAKTITLTATVGTDTYTYETATAKTFTDGQYYEITVKMTKYVPECSYTAPTLVSGTLTYNGSAQALVTGGSATGGTIYYSTNGGSSWSTDATGTNAGNYTVYYKVVPNDGYTGGVESTSLGTKTIDKANGWVTLSPNSSDGWGERRSRTSASANISHHGGSLSCSKNSGSSGFLNASISGNTLNLSRNSQIITGKGSVTVTSAATTNYNSASATYYCYD